MDELRGTENSGPRGEAVLLLPVSRDLHASQPPSGLQLSRASGLHPLVSTECVGIAEHLTRERLDLL